jgi:hypothetical protein
MLASMPAAAAAEAAAALDAGCGGAGVSAALEASRAAAAARRSADAASDEGQQALRLRFLREARPAASGVLRGHWRANGEYGLRLGASDVGWAGLWVGRA